RKPHCWPGQRGSQASILRWLPQNAAFVRRRFLSRWPQRGVKYMVMDSENFFSSVKDVAQSTPVLVALAILAVCVTVYLMVDAQRCRKKRPRHRDKPRH